MTWQLVPATRFEHERAHWTALHAASHGSPLLHADFVGALLAAFPQDGCLLARFDDVAMALLVPHGRGSWSTYQPAQAPVGIWLARPDADHATLMASLLRALPGWPLVLGLTQCDPWLMGRPADGARLRSADYIDSAHIAVEGSFDDWWQGRGKNLRANLKKQRARLAREGVHTRLDICRDGAAVAAAIEAYGALESAGWKAANGSAVGAANAQGRFYRAMLEAFCARGAAGIYRYYFNEQLVAMDLCIEASDYVVVLKTAYDESVPGHFSPALLMREEACRSMFDGGRLRRIEFYGKVMEWHLRWTDNVRALYHVNCYRYALLRRLHAARARPAGKAER